MTDREAEKRERERLALEATRLKNDDTLIRALAIVRQRAVDALIAADPTNHADIIRHQERVKLCDQFMAELETMITMQAIETASRFNG
jgi:hypothetical protein